MPEKQFPEYYNYLRGLLGKLGKELPGPMGGFGQLHKQAVADGTLTGKVKELIALAIAVAVHMHDALKAGASRQEVLEAVGVAVLMGGGPSVMYGAEALAALDQFQGTAAAKP